MRFQVCAWPRPMVAGRVRARVNSRRHSFVLGLCGRNVVGAGCALSAWYREEDIPLCHAIRMVNLLISRNASVSALPARPARPRRTLVPSTDTRTAPRAAMAYALLLRYRYRFGNYLGDCALGDVRRVDRLGLLLPLLLPTLGGPFPRRKHDTRSRLASRRRRVLGLPRGWRRGSPLLASWRSRGRRASSLEREGWPRR